MTRDQGDAILTELKEIRQLLEKQGVAKDAENAVPPSESVHLNLDSSWHALGKDDAPLTLIEFTDYQCSFCRSFQTDVFSELKKNYIDTGRVRFVSRDMPLSFHSFSLQAAEATRCAGDQGKYWEMRDVLIRNSANLSEQTIAKSAETLAIKMEDFHSCLLSGRYKADIQKDSDEAATLRIIATPTFVLAKTDKTLDGVKIIGAQPFGRFRAVIDEMLKSNANGSYEATNR